MFPFVVSASILFIPAFVLHDFCFSFSLLLCLLALMGFDIVFEQKMSLFLVAYTHNNTYNSGIDHLYIVPLAVVVIGCGENIPIRTINWLTTLTGANIDTNRERQRTKPTNKPNNNNNIELGLLGPTHKTFAPPNAKQIRDRLFSLRARPICY